VFGGAGAAGAGFVIEMAKKGPRKPAKQYHVVSVEAIRYPVLYVVYDDGFAGEYDLSELIATGPIFAALKDREYFRKVSVAPSGHSFGWNLDMMGAEIDFCIDSVRIDIETQRRNSLMQSSKRI
jgi:hypothetical protein